jgi:alanyl-tRNA synthetase
MALSSDEIRTRFVQFWQERGSRLVPSASLIPHDDPTVLFTIAGMQQFVPYFLGRQEAPFKRYTSVQKTFRTNDIDEVGDPSHLTFFEMLGNFSIGDYFKAEVIPWALEFVTHHLGLAQDLIWITIHESDDEADAIWRSVGIPADRITRLGDADNWWGPPGTSGPCGPDSEIYYAQGAGHGCGFPGDPEGCECGRLEIWNLVFMQFFQDEHGKRMPLPRKNVDTGMGLERCAAVVQRTTTVYETDLFMSLLDAGARLAGVGYGQDEHVDYALRVLADHGRGMTFLVADGVVPGNSGREYVLRRIVRRAIRYGRRLGIQGPFLNHMVSAVIDRMRAHYPELSTDRDRIMQVLENEEALFDRTLRAGSAQLDRLIDEARATGLTTVSGARVFDLYQTYGFPMELTEELIREEGLDFDRAGFEAALAEEQTRARARTGFRHAQHQGANEFVGVAETEFLAWTEMVADARVLGLRADGTQVPVLPAGTSGRLVLEASPFYPEGGGQIGDTGWIRTESGVFVVEDTRFDGAGHIVHTGHVAEGVLETGELARAEVDLVPRQQSMRHHTATHLLHRALKDVLGEGASQQGSYVGPQLLRFDVNHPGPITPAQLQDVGRIINERSMGDLPVSWQIMPLDEARRTGAVMMFGEKYGDEVRVVSIGDYSRELCGGTHTHHAGEVGLVIIGSESGIGSGKRRVVAYAGEAALQHMQQRLAELDTIAKRLGATGEDVVARVDQVAAEVETLRREVERLRHQRAHAAASELSAGARVVDGVKVVAQTVDHADDETLKSMVDAAREDLGSGVVVLSTAQDGRPRFVVGVTRDLTARGLHAGKLVAQVARAAGGGGGGRPDFATGGGGDPARVPAALDATYAVIAETLHEDGAQ